MKKFVILDDGHGIDTIGKCSPIFERQTKVGDITFYPGQRFKENMFNEDVMNMIVEELEKEKIPYGLTAPESKDVSLKERAERQNELYDNYANNGHTVITVSIHANGLGDGDNWNEVYGVETFYKNGSEKSVRLAQMIQKNAIEKRKTFKPYNFNKTNRGVKTANFYIFREFKGAVALFEGEFMTNIESLRLLCSNEYKKQIALSIVESILRF